MTANNSAVWWAVDEPNFCNLAEVGMYNFDETNLVNILSGCSVKNELPLRLRLQRGRLITIVGMLKDMNNRGSTSYKIT